MNIFNRFLPLIFLLLPVAQSWAENPYDNIRYSRGETFNYDDSQDKPWQEEGLKIPPPPKERDLVEVQMDGVKDNFTLWLDIKSLAIGENDRVLRYWLVLRSKTGAANTMYEGMRCSTKEYKTYAFASPVEEGKIDEMKNAKWLPTKAARGFQFRQELQDTYFCAFGVDKKRDEIVNAIKEANHGFYFGTSKSGPAAFY